jgi:excisionase family DNA binding protein
MVGWISGILRGMSRNNIREWLTTREAGDRLGIGVQRVLDLIYAGRLVAEKIGNSWMIDPDSVATFERRKPGPKPKKKQ